jgi:hypothetical protein
VKTILGDRQLTVTGLARIQAAVKRRRSELDSVDAQVLFIFLFKFLLLNFLAFL